MDPESDPQDPGRLYAKNLKDKIVRDATTSWAGSPDPGDAGFRLTPRLVIGLAIMLAGFLLALDSLGWADAGELFRYWPLALVAVGITKLFSSGGQRSGAFLLIVLGTAILALNLGWLSFPRVAAIVLFLVGARIAWKALAPRPAEPASVRSSSDVVAILGGSKRAVAGDFEGGQAFAFMGGSEVDLRRASMTKDEAVLDVFVFWGGIEVRVPEDWEVVSHGLPILGGFVDNTRHPPAAQKRLVVTGMAIMGGIELKN
jgi:predicted membrane protein